MLVWSGDFGDGTTLFEGGALYDPVQDEWSPMSTDGAPRPRAGGFAVWTGSEMIVWGGVDLVFDAPWRTDGGRYDPTLDGWTSMRDSPPGDGVGEARGAWTGSAALFWLKDSASHDVRAALYDPVADDWTLGEPLHIERIGAAAWNGGVAFVWSPELGKPYLHHLAEDRWSEATSAGAPHILSPSLTWTGEELILWGLSREGPPGAAFRP